MSQTFSTHNFLLKSFQFYRETLKNISYQDCIFSSPSDNLSEISDVLFREYILFMQKLFMTKIWGKRDFAVCSDGIS